MTRMYFCLWGVQYLKEMACAASIWNWAISNFNPILFMPFKTDFEGGTENKQKKSKLGHPNIQYFVQFKND